MKQSELKRALKPIIKECIKEVIFEEGVLSGLITEVAQGLGSVSPQAHVSPRGTTTPSQPSPAARSAKQDLNEVKKQLQQATGLKGVFEGVKPMASPKKGQSNKYGALRDIDPTDSGVKIDSLLKMTGGWSHLT